MHEAIYIKPAEMLWLLIGSVTFLRPALSVLWLVGQSVGWSCDLLVGLSKFPKRARREVTLPISYRSACLSKIQYCRFSLWLYCQRLSYNKEAMLKIKLLNIRKLSCKETSLSAILSLYFFYLFIKPISIVNLLVRKLALLIVWFYLFSLNIW